MSGYYAEEMDAARQVRCEQWLAALRQWAGDRRQAALACEVVRGIVTVDEPEYRFAVRWAGGAPDASDWYTGLELYGPVMSDAHRADRAERLVSAAQVGDRQTVQTLVRS